MRRKLADALDASADRALAVHDHAALQQLLAFGKGANLPATQLAALSARIAAMPKAGDVLPGPFGGLDVVRHGDALVGVARRAVSREDYERFAKATSRPATLCRERTSLLRIVKPRDWRSPGFKQSAGDPVVCVSYADAAAYAQWMQKQSGERYRLPRSGEVASSGGGGERHVSQWLDACSGGCAKRNVVGGSWRDGDNSRALDADRGYDDVGFRLVRDE
jgi:hypothetical protein